MNNIDGAAELPVPDSAVIFAMNDSGLALRGSALMSLSRRICRTSSQRVRYQRLNWSSCSTGERSRSDFSTS
jgi:hypothetical protein